MISEVPHRTASKPIVMPPPRDNIAAARVLVVDDDRLVRENICGLLQDAGYATEDAADGATALERLRTGSPDLVLLDLKLDRSRLTGMEVLERIIRDAPGVPVVMISGAASIRNALDATNLGAYDFLEKPLNKERILLTVRNALDKVRLERERRHLLAEAGQSFHLIGSGAAMQKVFHLIERAAASDSKVLIQGESGTGKDVVAHAIHAKSSRAGGPFVAVNCAALPEDLIESELFGYEKGAFTGAHRAHQGKFEQAQGGTLFLDEIGDMSPATQAKILRVLDTGTVSPLSGKQAKKLDVRVIAATNKQLKEAVQAGRFRSDLYYRLNIIHIHTPPLHDRREDIPALIDHFLLHFWREEGLPLKHMGPPEQALMIRHEWPGNIRELRNMVERLLVLSEGETITTADIERVLSHAEMLPLPGRPHAGGHTPRFAPLHQALAQYEHNYLLQALVANGWRRKETAEVLGINRTYLWRKMQRFHIEEPGS